MKKESITNLSQQRVLIFFLFLSSFFCFSFVTQATVNTYTWQDNYRGYSIEQVPGSNPVEYVAAGTIHDAGGIDYDGIHFLHLNSSGNVITSKTIWKDPNLGDYNAYRVIDIAVESANAFWITTSARHLPTPSKDFIYAIRVDIGGNIAGTPSFVEITNNTLTQTNYTNLYPTHTIFHNNALYISAYASDYTSFFASPDNYTTDKICMVFKADMSITPNPIITSYAWNTQANGSYDYDMPLKMRLDNSQNYLFVTGAANNTSYVDCSGILALKLDLNLTKIAENIVYVPGRTWPQQPPTNGFYGIDILENSSSGDVYILSNYYVNDVVYRWGVFCLNNNLNATPGKQTYMFIDTHVWPVHWAKQFLVSDFASGTIVFDIVGEVIDLHNTCGITPPSNPPSTSNVNPFIANYTLTGNAANGYSSISNNYTYIHLTATNTSASGLDYINGNSQGALDDIRRANTFATRSNNGITMIVPWSEQTNSYLNAKFIAANNSGTESDCNKTYVDCDPGLGTAEVFEVSNHIQINYNTENQTEQFLVDQVSIPVEQDCQNGSYKKGETTGINDRDFKANAIIKIWPNPANDIVTITAEQQVWDEVKSIEVLDITGKLISKSEVYPVELELQVNTSTWVSGTYFINITMKDNSMVNKKLILSR